MNSENAPKEIVKSFTENMEKGLMNENQQPSVQQKLKRGEEKGGESRELHRVGVGESSASATTDINTSFATPSTTTKYCRSMGIKNLWRLSVNLLFFPCKTQ